METETQDTEQQTTEAEPQEAQQGGEQAQETAEETTPKPRQPLGRSQSSEERGRGMNSRMQALEAELAASRQMTQQMVGMMQGLMKPQQNNETDRAYRSRLDRALALAQSNPGAGTGEFYDALEELSREANGELRRKLEALEKRLENAPRPVDPILSGIQTRYPWIADEKKAAIADGFVRLLVERDDRDMEDPEVRARTLEEAAAMTARELGLGGTKTNPDRQIQQQRLVGTSGKDSGAGNVSATPQLAEWQERLAESAFPNLDSSAAHAAWWKQIGVHLRK